MRAYQHFALIALAATLLYAEDFNLTQNGFGPITVHTQLTYEGKGERLRATATNDSGQAIPYVKLCVKTATKGCLFELWNTEQWKPGATLSFDLTSSQHVPNLAHEVVIEELNISKTFSLTKDGFGPITVHSELTYEGKGERLRATATNDSGQSIPYVRLCVRAATSGCLFELWNTEQWKPGVTLDFNLTSSQHVPDLAHEVTIEVLNLPKDAPKAAAPVVESTKTVVQPAVAVPAALPQPVNRAGLTNDAILKMVKAGLGDEVIVAMVNNQTGAYSLDSDDVIALKQSGVSDKVIAAMLNKGAGSAVAAPNAPHIASEPLVLHDGTPVRLRLARNLSSADAKTGETIDFEVLDDVQADGILLIQRGAVANGTVTDAEPKKRMARGGKLDVTIDYVRLVDGERVALRGAKDTSGGGHTGAMTGGIVATALIVWPAAPFFLFMHGKDTMIPKGTEIAAYVNGEIKLDRAKLSVK
jgi:hypothetical protein